MTDKINNLDEAILNISKSRENRYGDPEMNDVLYSRWNKRYSETLDDFYSDFIEPRLPNPEVVLEWHKVLIEYSQMDRAIFPIRDGHSDAKDNRLKLRRGWLVRVDDHIDYEKKFSYTFTDNHLATYIYKMALDGYCPTPGEFFEFMTKFKKPSDIGWLQGREVKNAYYNGEERHFMSMPVHFGWIGKSSYPGYTESQKNVYINTSPAPTAPFGEYGYKHAHIFAVKDKSGLYKFRGEEVEWKNIKLVKLGEENNVQKDYIWDDTIKNFVWDRKMKDSDERDELRSVVVAHFLRFCDPINHFLTPKQGCNKFTTSSKEFSLDIAEYENLISHLIFIREKIFGDEFAKYRNMVLAVDGLKEHDNGDEKIDIIYHEDKQEMANKKNRADREKSTPEKKKRDSKKSSTSLKIIKHDRSKYSFDGAQYYKGPLIVALVDKYLEDNPNADFDELRRVFDLTLVFNNKPIILLSKDTPASLKSKAPERKMSDGTSIYINNQVQIDDMEHLLDIANALCYKVDKVK